jgi:hypothetical protein
MHLFLNLSEILFMSPLQKKILSVIASKAKQSNVIFIEIILDRHVTSFLAMTFWSGLIYYFFKKVIAFSKTGSRFSIISFIDWDETDEDILVKNLLFGVGDFRNNHPIASQIVS